MFFNTFAAVLAPFLLLGPCILASPIRARRHTPEIYYLANCFKSSDTTIQRAEVDYYIDSAFSGNLEKPDCIGIFNPTSSIDYEDGTWTVSTPFKFKAVIQEDAYTASAGTIVGSATASTYAGKLSCTRLKRIVLYKPDSDTKCYSDYACTDTD